MVKTGEKLKVAAAKKNPSPDTVACIDLTGSGKDFFPPVMERRLGSVRKELEPPSAKKRGRGGLKTTGLDDADGHEIIVIDSDDDEDIPMAYNDDDCAIVEVDSTPAPVASRPNVASRPDDTSRPAKKAKAKEAEALPLKTVKKEGANKIYNEVDGKVDSEGVEVVEATAPVLAAATMVPEQAKNTATDKDVVVEGVLNETRLPHMRQHCTRCPFNFHSVTSSRRETNSSSCDLCYCYVCDCPVKDCKNWYSSTSTSPEDNHCCASEKERSWEKMRSRAKSQASISGFYRENLPYYNSDEESEDMDESENGDENPPYHLPRILFDQWREQRERRRNSTYVLAGPFEPDHPDAPRNNELTKCRHCSWFSRLRLGRLVPSSDDWCKVCGRVASEADLEKKQVAPANNTSEEAQAGTYLLGEKEISFRIKAHDPRLFDEYKTKWQENSSDNSAWHYDQADRDEEVFLHRIGRSPTFDNIQRIFPHVANENIPDKIDGSNPRPNNERDGTDAIIIEDPREQNLVYGLSGLFISDSNLDSPCLKIAATWDKTSRKGTLKLRLELPKNSFVGKNTYSRKWTFLQGGQVMLALGIWYGLFPLKPSELCIRLNGLNSEEIIDQMNRKWSATYNIPMSPYRVEMKDVIETLREQLSTRVERLSSAKDEYESQLTMTPSDGSRFGGGVCIRDPSNSFRNSMIRLFSEHFPSMMCQHCGDDDLVASCKGATRRRKYSRVDSILGFQTAIAAQASFEADASDCDSEKYRVSSKLSIKDIMVRVENLGHGSEDCVEGLKIELLEFQRQSLKWALECERTPGGVQSFFWSKVPNSGEKGDLYYHPILKSFRKDKPALVRGGFIAEQMGLGKTVISLALILKNPAPKFPLSGSSIADLKKKGPNADNSESVGWDENLCEKKGLGHLSNKKTGSIICRGTLVICPVSLVGQWIDEARSKLEDPGLIYPYHGQNRMRDPRKLAANSIVVTTYDILASDAFRRSKYTTGPDYCPPLQQIRWWRIICDEGHLLRESNTGRSRSVLSLVADNKWIVTGTPMNTSLTDLKNQFRFLGFEHVEKVFGNLISSYAGRGNRSVEIDNLLYLLRPIMMRHSQQQKYRGTSTTLMSLPKKTERVQKITFTKSEKKEYKKIEKSAQKWYMDFRATNRKDISKHFLKISSKLTPLRISCSGGKYPLSSGKGDMEDDLDPGMGTNRPNKERKYSDFAFESKFNILLAKLEKIRDTEPDSKSLVFSQFSSTLDWLKVQLPTHGFQFRTLTGDMTMKKRAKALSDFQNDPPTTIFLLSMRSGAVGINLTQANRVFLMEPSFNPALEAQAIGRVHRLGQKRPVEIVKLVVKDSFEERMMKFLKKKYGSNSEKKPEEASESEEKTNSNGKKLNSQAGNLKADKVQLVTEEFDSLFGVEDRLSDAATQSVGEDDDMKADVVPSIGNA